MATRQEQDEESRLQAVHMRQRQALGNAYASLLGDQNTQTFAAFTFEDAVDIQIERIEGASTALRPNELERVTKVADELLKAVEELKSVPPEQFRQPDE